MAVCLQKYNQAYFYIVHIHILFINVIVFVFFLSCAVLNVQSVLYQFMSLT